MKLRKLLYSIIIISAFVTGCSKSENINTNESLPNEEMKHRMMTKVQNNVNEIMNKDYEYVIENMGKPYCTTYYIDSDNPREIRDKRLIYPKYTEGNKLDKSALYINLRDDHVVEVQTYEISKEDLNEKYINDGADIIVDRYNYALPISLSSVEKIDINNFIGKDTRLVYEYFGDKSPSLEAYSKAGNRNIDLYEVESSGEIKLLVIFSKENKIEDIKIINQEKLVNILKQYLDNK
ncbi:MULTISPECIES: hypothetical protein [Romboutsia]|uniref:Prokaryotic membrane lipoprotein lipid attachment site profile n=1 Tax=Romboutsia hominis TaxID=1507512 RepID=A0A2P2BNS1_9FIRM|nr:MULTISPECIES: hypothetical protein [Romboutsia]MDB8790216.1 hypothetical protein [Romboutsia sp. 1001216sp1]MDB8792137.1 hypothetical protein [Romboutsia sp. 1001216sp1]MDB8797104.1 hypothetical protein [Romboutsia sp. 1001216sp1]MDB8798690.1 hypothetical protein [Romboutsia sp. 1001216sp1]MDB8800596.1 hypothetical protein [Romboutsia sp. 1001216sp1]